MHTITMVTERMHPVDSCLQRLIAHCGALSYFHLFCCTLFEGYNLYLGGYERLIVLPALFFCLYRMWILIVEMWCNDRLIDLSWAAVDGRPQNANFATCNHIEVVAYAENPAWKQTEADLNTQPTYPPKHENKHPYIYIYICWMVWICSSMCGNNMCTWTCHSPLVQCV